jgi:hypothetical protein
MMLSLEEPFQEPETWHLAYRLFDEIMYWAIPFVIYTPPVEDLDKIFHRGSVDFKWISQLGNSF